MIEFLKLNNKWFKYITLVVFSILVVVVCHVSLKVSKIPTEVYSLRIDEEAYEAYGLKSGDFITQEFETDSDFGIVSLKFNLGNIVEGNTRIKIIALETGEVIYDEQVNNNEIDKSGLYDVNMYCSDIGKANTIYQISLEITGDNSETTGISVYLAKNHSYNGQMTINSQKVDSILNLGTCRHSTKLTYVYWITILLSIVSLSAVGYAIIIRQCNIERVFAIGAICFGIVYIIMFPADGLCDSQYHYEQIYKHANNVLSIFDNTILNDSNTLYMRESDYEAYVRCISNTSDDVDGNDYLNIVKNFSVFSSDNTMIDATTKQTDNGYIHYIPQVITMILGRVFNLGALPIMYIIRIVGLMIFTGGIVWAIRVTPVGKEIFAAVGLMPTCLEQVTGFSYDTIIVPLVLIFIAYWLLYMYGNDECLSKRIYIYILVLAFLIGACKGGLYGFVLLLLLSVPNTRLGFNKKLIALGIAMLAVAVSYGSYIATIGSQVSDEIIVSTAELNELSGGSFYGNSYIFIHPIKFVGLIIGAIVESPQVFFGSMIGTHLQTSRLMADMAVIIPFIVIIILLCATDKDDPIIVNKKCKMTIMITIILFCLFLGFLMLAETPRGWNMQGFNGRYFIPFMPIILLLFRQNGIIVDKDKKIRLILSLTVWQVIMVFYLITYMLSK